MAGAWDDEANPWAAQARTPRNNPHRSCSPALCEQSAPVSRRAFLRRAGGVGAAVLWGTALASLTAGCSGRPTSTCRLGSAGNVEALEKAMGARLGYERIFHRTEAFPGPEETAAWRAGRVPVSSFKTLDVAGAPTPFGDVATGASDAQLDQLAAAFRDRLRGEMVLIYFHEPESEAGDAPEDFAAAFRHVRGRIESELDAQDRARLRWAMTLTYFYYANGEAERFYPGDDAVDLVTADGYNWCPGAGHGSDKVDFAQLFAPCERFAAARAKPWMVTEVATWADPTPGWTRAEWIDRIAPVATTWPTLEAIMWFEHATGFQCDWSIGGDPAALAAFRALGKDLCTSRG